MAAKPPMKRSPAKKSIDLEKLNDFAAAAVEEPANEASAKTKQTEPARKTEEKNELEPEGRTEKSSKPKAAKALPWDRKEISEKIPKPFNLRTNQVQVEKLKYIVKNTVGFKSVHAFCMDAVEKRINAELKKLLE